MIENTIMITMMIGNSPAKGKTKIILNPLISVAINIMNNETMLNMKPNIRKDYKTIWFHLTKNTHKHQTLIVMIWIETIQDM